jgi:hypothetical protein
MDLIEDIGPILGIAAFLGFAILALLIVLQAREVRRLREWAGRAPERAAEADDADKATAEARGDEPDLKEPGRLAALRERAAEAVAPRWEAIDRRSPVDPRWLLAVIAAGLIAVGVVTGGFGLTGGDDAAPVEETTSDSGGSDGGEEEPKEPKPTVVVLNATQDETLGLEATPGIADVVADQLVRPADFQVTQRTNAPAGQARTLIMFQPDAEDAAQELAGALQGDLGRTDTVPVTDEVSAVAQDAELVLLVGRDDATFGVAAP